MVISNPNIHGPNICDGFECFKEAICIITEKINNTDITFQLCESCASNLNSINGLTEANKKMLGQQVVEPACSNTSSQNQSLQQQQSVAI